MSSSKTTMAPIKEIFNHPREIYDDIIPFNMQEASEAFNFVVDCFYNNKDDKQFDDKRNPGKLITRPGYGKKITLNDRHKDLILISNAYFYYKTNSDGEQIKSMSCKFAILSKKIFIYSLISQRNSSLFEVIPHRASYNMPNYDSQWKHCMYFDFDFAPEPLTEDEFNQLKEITAYRAVNAVRNAILNIPELAPHIQSDLSSWLVFSSCFYNRTLRKKKISFHIYPDMNCDVRTNAIIAIAAQKEYIALVTDREVGTDEKFDLGVYSMDRQFRAAFTSKPGLFAPKEPVKVITDGDENSIFFDFQKYSDTLPSDPYFQSLSPEQQAMYLLTSRSLVSIDKPYKELPSLTNIPIESRPKGFKAPVFKERSDRSDYVNLPFPEENITAAEDLLKFKVPQYHWDWDTNSNLFIGVNNRAGKKCPICQRIHDNENAFAYLRHTDTCVYFRCRRDETGQSVSYDYGFALPVREEEDSPIQDEINEDDYLERDTCFLRYLKAEKKKASFVEPEFQEEEQEPEQEQEPELRTNGRSKDIYQSYRKTIVEMHFQATKLNYNIPSRISSITEDGKSGKMKVFFVDYEDVYAIFDPIKYRLRYMSKKFSATGHKKLYTFPAYYNKPFDALADAIEDFKKDPLPPIDGFYIDLTERYYPTFSDFFRHLIGCVYFTETDGLYINKDIGWVNISKQIYPTSINGVIKIASYEYSGPKFWSPISYLYSRQGIVFTDLQPPGIPDKLKLSFNTFRLPVYPEDIIVSAQENYETHIDFYTQFVREQLAPTEEDAEYIHNWVAHVVQKPLKKTQKAVMLVSPEKGVGKSTFLTMLRKINANSQDFSSKGLLGIIQKFNSSLANKNLIIIPEMGSMKNLDPQELSTLKALITDDGLQVERKGKETYDSTNYSNFICALNDVQNLSFESSERRYFVSFIDNPVHNAQDVDYWTETSKIFENPEFLCAIRMFYENRDISEFNPRAFSGSYEQVFEMQKRQTPLKEYFSRELKKSGVKIIIDDFIAEYSQANPTRSLAPFMLKNQLLRMVKTDADFIKTLEVTDGETTISRKKGKLNITEVKSILRHKLINPETGKNYTIPKNAKTQDIYDMYEKHLATCSSSSNE